MKKVVRLTSSASLVKNEEKFKISAQKIGEIDIDFIDYKELFYDVDGKFKGLKNEEEIGEYDYFRIGGPRGINFKGALIYYYGVISSKRIIDPNSMQNISYSKLIQIILINHLKLSQPKSIFFTYNELLIPQQMNIILKRFQFPLILKIPDLERGQGVFLIKTKDELQDKLSSFSPKDSILIQEFIPNQGDYRIIATSKSIIGVIKRYNDKSFKNNVSTGGTAEAVVNIPPIIQDITPKIIEAYGLDISGVDFFIEGDKYYVIEINRLPQYQGFEQATNISYTEEVLKYIKNLE